MEVSSFDDVDAIGRAARAVADGQVVGAGFGTVFGLVVDGAHDGAADRILELKGAARGHKPLGACLPPGRIHETIDATALDDDARDLLAQPWFARRLAAMVAVRAPAAPDARIPGALRSHVDGRDWVQVFNPQHMPGAADLIAAVGDAGVRWVAATSMNESGQTEIVDTDSALAFAERHGLHTLFASPSRHAASGSLPILELRPGGLRLDRHGIIAIDDLRRAIDRPIDDAGAVPAHYPPMRVGAEVLRGLDPARATTRLLRMLYPGTKIDTDVVDISDAAIRGIRTGGPS